MEKYSTMEAEGAGPEIFPTWQSIMIQILPWETTFFSREVSFPTPTLTPDSLPCTPQRQTQRQR